MAHTITNPPQRHHRQKGDAKRVRLSGGPWIDRQTLATLTAWHRQGPSYGEIIDRLTTHAQATDFDPAYFPVLPE